MSNSNKLVENIIAILGFEEVIISHNIKLVGKDVIEHMLFGSLHLMIPIDIAGLSAINKVLDDNRFNKIAREYSLNYDIDIYEMLRTIKSVIHAVEDVIDIPVEDESKYAFMTTHIS